MDLMLNRNSVKYSRTCWQTWEKKSALFSTRYIPKNLRREGEPRMNDHGETHDFTASFSLNVGNIMSIIGMPTPWRSRAVSQSSITQAWYNLALEIWRDPNLSVQYGRQLMNHFCVHWIRHIFNEHTAGIYAHTAVMAIFKQWDATLPNSIYSWTETSN